MPEYGAKALVVAGVEALTDDGEAIPCGIFSPAPLPAACNLNGTTLNFVKVL